MALRVLFGVIVSPICAAFAPCKVKLALCLSAFEPIESHIISFGGFWDHCFSDESMSSVIVGCDLGFHLGVPHLL